MISTSTFAFALVLVAVVSVAAAWIIWQRLTQALDSERTRQQTILRSVVANINEHKKLISECKRVGPADLADRVDALSVAVDKLRDTQRRFQGRFDAKMNGLGTKAPETPEETRQRLREQHGLPKLGRLAGEQE